MFIANTLRGLRLRNTKRPWSELDISPATLMQWVHEAVQALAPTVLAIAQCVQAAAICQLF